MPASKGNSYAKGNKGGGRKSDYKPSYCKLAYQVCLLGATDKEIATIFEVSETTINKWKSTFPKFKQALNKGKIVADANVADRLYQRALGFEHDSEEIKVVDSTIQRVAVRKIYPPDTVAAIFWLKNRQKDKWRDKTEQEVSVNSFLDFLKSSSSETK